MRRQLTPWYVMVGVFCAFLLLAVLTLVGAVDTLRTGLNDVHDVGETGGEVYLAGFLFFVAACFLFVAYLTFRWLRR